MDPVVAAMLYLTVFRLSIAGAGVLCVILGYRLFTRGIARNETAEAGQSSEDLPTGSTVEGKFGDSTLMLRNLAPGTCFALFGMTMIYLVSTQGAPEAIVTLPINEAAAPVPSLAVELRDPDEVTIAARFAEAKRLLAAGDEEGARGAFHGIVVAAGPTINNLAYRSLAGGRAEDAVNLARVAVYTEPANVNYLGTLAAALCKLGERDEAMSVQARMDALSGAGTTSARIASDSGGDCE